MSIGSFVLGAALFIASPSTSAQAFIRAAAVWVTLVAALLLLLYLVVRRAAAPAGKQDAEQDAFAQSTTMFEQPTIPHEPRE